MTTHYDKTGQTDVNAPTVTTRRISPSTIKIRVEHEGLGVYEQYDRISEWGDPADGGVTAAAIENEANRSRAEAESSARCWASYAKEQEKRADKAEAALDEMTASRDRSRNSAIKWQVEANRLRAAQPRPLTAPDITDEMAERARAALSPLWQDRTSRDRVRDIIAAALTPEPQRPEWADLADKIDDAMAGPGGIDGDTLAERLHAEGVRVTTEDDQ